jgi:glycosyltransferase involved in cell wall biosynthesis
MIWGLMAGDGPLRSECEAKVRESNSRIRFTGFLNQREIVLAYKAADALVLPSDGRETWGLVVNEAMICGRSCFVSDQVGSGPDLIECGRTGDIFSTGRVDHLARLLSTYAIREKLAQMGRSAQQNIDRYSPDFAASALGASVIHTLQRTHA